MPYTITIEPTFLRVVLYGAVTSQDLQDFADALLAIEVPLDVTPHRLCDFSALAEPHLTYPAMRFLVERRKAHPVTTPIKTAIVAARPIHRGLARMLQTLNEQPDIAIEIFATVESAESWLRGE
jgi:hypothetical protein